MSKPSPLAASRKTTHQKHSRKTHRSKSSLAAPPLVRATAALAWFVAALCCLHATTLWHSKTGEFSDVVYFLGLGGGAAYLGMTLPRRVVSAWRSCRQLAAATGTINMVILPSLVVAGMIGIGYRLWLGVDPAVADWVTKLSAAAAATAIPWAFYHVLGDVRVRTWFCAVDCR
ncbi:hypothetical protein [Botrimarina colliarenosi]|nr:hypothetical protein [Botrimarina colliarenosi]